MNKYYIPKFNKEEIHFVTSKLNPLKNKACNNDILWNNGTGPFSGNFYGNSLKRSHLSECIFKEAIFDHTSFAGSIFSDVSFLNSCSFQSTYFERSVLKNVKFEENLKFENTSFLDCQMDGVSFESTEIRGSFFNNSFLEKCSFKDCLIRSTMFDNVTFSNCKVENCNMRNLNIEFSCFVNSDLTGTTISYFQFPYIIGIFSGNNNIDRVSLGIHGDVSLSLDEYTEQIDDAIIYFTSINEYFPLANLYYKKGQDEIAHNCLLEGIDKALLSYDFSMIANYCRLGQLYNLLSINDIKKVLDKVDQKLEHSNDNEFYDTLMLQAYKLRATLSQDRSKTKLEVTINTSINEHDFSCVTNFCEDIDSLISMIMPNRIHTSYQISHNSPFEIVLQCIGLTADILGISGFIYGYIEKRAHSNIISDEIKSYINYSNETFINSINNQFDDFEAILSKTKKSEQKAIVKSFKGRIIESISSQISKDFELIVSQRDQ